MRVPLCVNVVNAQSERAHTSDRHPPLAVRGIARTQLAWETGAISIFDSTQGASVGSHITGAIGLLSHRESLNVRHLIDIVLPCCDFSGIVSRCD
jgi:hypothetical protein